MTNINKAAEIIREATGDNPMTTNQQKAAELLLEKDREESFAVAINHDAFLRASEQRREDAQALADAGLLAPDLPDEWIDADKLRGVLQELDSAVTSGHGDQWDSGYNLSTREWAQRLKKLLPTPPSQRTMDEIEWSDEEHHLAEALFGDTRKVVMLARDTDEEGDWSEWVHCRIEDGSTDLIEKAYLTPTGRKYRLEPEDDVAVATGGELTTQDVVDECRAVRKERATPEPAAPRPEDVPVGEPWQVEAEGQAAIGYRNDTESRLCWAVVYPHHTGRHWVYDSEVTLIARLVHEATKQDDNEQGAVPEFDPAYIYRDRHGDEWHYYEPNRMWICRDSRGWHVRADSVPPTRFGPYTRIEDTK